MAIDSKTIEIVYDFRCAGGDKRHASMRVVLDAETLVCVHREGLPQQEWTELSHSQCRVCPLTPETHPHCPAALSFVEILEEFGVLLSYTEVEATVTTRERTTTLKTSVQKALSSLVGLCMATSGCPILARFKPMARFHLPFATREETIFRSVGAYLVAQYLLKRRDKEVDLDLKGLRETYDLIHEVNVGLADRLRTIPVGDAHLNAIVILDLFAHALPSSIDEGLAEIEHMFHSFLQNDTPKSAT